MKRASRFLLLCFSSLMPVMGEETKSFDIPKQAANSILVFRRDDGGQGTGFIVKREVAGKERFFVYTNQHVIAGCKTIPKAMRADGTAVTLGKLVTAVRNGAWPGHPAPLNRKIPGTGGPGHGVRDFLMDSRSPADMRDGWLPCADSETKPAICHCIARVVDKRFAFGPDDKEQFRIYMRMMENFSGCCLIASCATTSSCCWKFRPSRRFP